MKITYIIIEDNPGAIENLNSELKKHEYLQELGQASNAKDGIALALNKSPHLIFLDVELGKENGFHVLEEISQRSGKPPHFIITTDYLKYGKEAVNRDALYFLDKPIDPDELETALFKVQSHIKKQDKYLRIKNSEGHFFIALDDIQYIESKNNCCTIYRNNFPAVTVSQTLKDIQADLSNHFLRIHNRYIVNRKNIQMMNTTKKVVQVSVKENGAIQTIKLPIGNFYLSQVKQVMLGSG